ncbi:TPA: hypothetical protein DIV55_03900 [Patescibacteria group bacterium]|uniref:Uncharacterized protein n=1 Tax=Candidatus Gottesmanbacteria bacterium GW2011_GWA1_43_11 TaxID=1618436 RepID=A0A0G1CEZ2_9BACT|nr:MAG: hypothetical protein UV59_C0027G0020 [Candidatus Gottesmanbacteria bacterium GW2011_GWA1_43_11]HCS78863.1 hypothetical protein [Patescibacteria group bacterium]
MRVPEDSSFNVEKNIARIIGVADEVIVTGKFPPQTTLKGNMITHYGLERGSFGTVYADGKNILTDPEFSMKEIRALFF